MAEDAFVLAYPHARRSAEVYAARAIRGRFAALDEREDLVQDALLAAWLQMRRFDSRRAGLRTFTEIVVRSAIGSSLRKRRHVRDHGLAFDRCVGDASNHARAIQRRVDVALVLERCHPFDRKVAMLLVDHSPSEVATAMRVARSTVYRSIERLRAAFANAWNTSVPSKSKISSDVFQLPPTI